MLVMAKWRVIPSALKGGHEPNAQRSHTWKKKEKIEQSKVEGRQSSKQAPLSLKKKVYKDLVSRNYDSV